MNTSTMRTDGRPADALREISLTGGTNPYAEGSCLVKFGRTEVLCTASLMDGIPRWLKGKGTGWLTAEYGMLPRATHDRKDREAVKGKQEGRTVEIQRLIGRSLRAVTDLRHLNGFTMWLDCDVLVADGGTRTAAITGAWAAAAIAAQEGVRQRRLKQTMFTDQVAAISCGLTSERVILDMDYAEDSTTLADANFVRSAGGHWIEIQMSAEQRPVNDTQLDQMKSLAKAGIAQLFEIQSSLVAQYR